MVIHMNYIQLCGSKENYSDPLFSNIIEGEGNITIRKLYQCAVQGCFDSKEAKVKLKNWVQQSGDDAVKALSERICGVENPKKELLNSTDIVKIFNDEEQFLIGNWLTEQHMYARALAFYMSQENIEDTTGFGKCVEQYDIKKLVGIYHILRDKGNIRLAVCTALKIIKKLGDNEEGKASYYRGIIQVSGIKENPNDTSLEETAFNALIVLGNTRWQGDPRNEESIQFYLWAYELDPTTFGEHISRILQYYMCNEKVEKALIFFKNVYIKHEDRPIDELAKLLTKGEDWLPFVELIMNTEREKNEDEKQIDRLFEARSISDRKLAAYCVLCSQILYSLY